MINEIYDLYNSFAEQGLIPENYSELIEKTMLKDKEKAKAFFKSTKDSGSDLETRQKATQHKITLPQILNDKIAILSEEQASEEESNVPPIKTTEAWKDYQKQVDSTMTRYDGLIQKLKDQIKSEAEPIVFPSPIIISSVKVAIPVIAAVPLISTLPLISIRVEFNSISSSALISKSPSAGEPILIAESRN